MTVLPAVRGSPSRWPLVGRREEMDLVADALADHHTQGVVVCGPAGVGKTRLAEESLAAAQRRGRVVGRATATAAAATVPLGALVPLLPRPTGDRSDPVTLFDWAATAFREQAGDTPFILLLDDLHLLDVTSAVLLGQLLDAGVIFLLGTVRDGEPISAGVAGWWRSERMLRIDLGDLSADGVDGLLHLALGGPATAATAAQVWTASRGNPLFVRELVMGAQTAGNLADESGVWRLTGPLHTTTRLAELVGARMEAVGSAARPALELLALTEPAGLSELEDLVGADAMEALEGAGLIDVRADRRRQLVSLTHPLYGEVLRGRIQRLTRRRLLLAHVERIEREGARRREDPLRIATWRLEATGTADPKLLVVAARLARYGYDLAQAARLARAALTDLDTGPARVEAQLVLGEALTELGQFAEAEDVLAQAESAAEDELQLVPVVAIRVRSLLWGLRRPERALEVNRAARTRVTGREAREELIANEATLLMFSGHPLDALSVLAGLDDTAELRTRVLRAIPEASAMVVTGRAETAATVARRALAEHLELGDQLAIAHPGTHVMSQVYALQEAGQLAEATELALSGHEIASRDRSPIGRIWFAIHLGRCAMLTGRPQTGRRWLAEARALCREYGWHGPHRLALSALAIVTAWLDDPVAARDAVNEQNTLDPFGHMRAEQDLGRAWAAAAEGDLVAARDIARTAVAQAGGSGHLSSEALLLHELARLGDPAGARDRLAVLAAHCEGVLIAAYAEHARAAAARDGPALSAVADRFEAIGADLMAAEAATEAGQAYQRDGNPRMAATLRARAATLAARCEGARTPALATTTAVVPLTPREREIALLAKRGQTSRQIADRLRLSVRTVDNHLQNVYTKLGITAREQLGEALPAPGERLVTGPVPRQPPRPS